MDGDVKVRELKRQGLGRFIVFFWLGVGGKEGDGGPPTRHIVLTDCAAVTKVWLAQYVLYSCLGLSISPPCSIEGATAGWLATSIS